MINSQTTVREIAIQVPEATRLFEKFKIDYCCGGNRPLTEACNLAGVDVDNVIEMLAQTGQSQPETTVEVGFSDLSLADLVNYMDYMAEPVRNKRIHLGIVVLLFLSVLFFFAYWMKREYWKDLH